jgi:hypothetical protein
MPFQGDEREGEGSTASTAKKSRKLGMSFFFFMVGMSFTFGACLYCMIGFQNGSNSLMRRHLPLIYQLFAPLLSFDPRQQLNQQNATPRFDPTPISLLHSHGSSFYQSFNVVIHPLQQIHF